MNMGILRDKLLVDNHKDTEATEEQKSSYANGVLDYHNAIIKELSNG